VHSKRALEQPLGHLSSGIQQLLVSWVWRQGPVNIVQKLSLMVQLLISWAVCWS